MANRVVELETLVENLAVGWVVGLGCQAGPSPDSLVEETRDAVTRCAALRESPGSTARKGAVRDMLRHGTYRPTGRAKPASEYLLNAAAEGQFPFISNLVDINNLVSLESLLPISLVDVDKAGTERFAVRFGREGEEYVFNPSGQVLSLRDLLLVARAPSDEPCATPVKDSQATKTDEGTRDVLGVLYAPRSLQAVAAEAAARMADLLRTHAGAATTHGVLT